MGGIRDMVLAAGISFGTAVLLGGLLTPLFKKLSFAQGERPEGPKSHLKKAGTPSLGGVILLGALVPGVLLAAGEGLAAALPCLLVTVAFGLVGFVDDSMKIRRKSAQGLPVWQKVLLQFALSLGAALYLFFSGQVGPVVGLPLFGGVWNMGVLYIPFAVLVLMGTVNGVNLTDGLDGLAAGISAMTELSYGVLFCLMAAAADLSTWGARAAGQEGMAAFCGAAAGSCLGFLLFNSYPARIFMGDTGSLALGGALAMGALTSGQALLLPLMGVGYVVSVVTVILQVGSWKLRGKRIFKMAPLHHHFELCGVPEPKITAMYLIFTAAACLFGLLLYLL